MSAKDVCFDFRKFIRENAGLYDINDSANKLAGPYVAMINVFPFIFCYVLSFNYSFGWWGTTNYSSYTVVSSNILSKNI